jgi:hypothetical protein
VDHERKAAIRRNVRVATKEPDGLASASTQIALDRAIPWYRDNMKTSMAIESPVNAKPRRRATTTGTLVGTRFQATLLEAIDSWRKDQIDLPTRPEAVRRLVELGMTCGEAPANGSSTRRVERQLDDKT